jgi:hypothetical protein
MKITRTADADYYDSHPEDLKENLTAVNAVSNLRTSTYVLGDPLDENAPAAAVILYPPNWVLPRHTHACERLEIVIEGSISAGDLILSPGDVMEAHRGELYGPHVIGPEGCKTLEVFGNRRGYHLLTFEDPSGQLVELDIASDDAAKAVQGTGSESQIAARSDGAS